MAARQQALQRSGFSPKNKSAVGLRAILRRVYRTVPNETKRNETERYANDLGRRSATLHSGFMRIFAKRNGIELNDFGNVFLTHTVCSSWRCWGIPGSPASEGMVSLGRLEDSCIGEGGHIHQCTKKIWRLKNSIWSVSSTGL